MTLLVRHPDTPPGAIQAIEAELQRAPGGAVARFQLVGDIAKLVFPPPAERVRTDELWKTTCLEVFIGDGGPAYAEINLSPSGAWAAYQFDGYRSGMRDMDVHISMRSSLNSKSFALEATIECELANPAWVGLTAVIEETDGIGRYWSTAFAPGKADFHAPAVRSLLFDGIGTE